jgi:hypothetical protein
MKRVRPCEYCGTWYLPSKAGSRFCTRRCAAQSQGQPVPPRPLYAYNGRLSDGLWREIHAARAEMATAPLYRPGSVG